MKLLFAFPRLLARAWSTFPSGFCVRPTPRFGLALAAAGVAAISPARAADPPAAAVPAKTAYLAAYFSPREDSQHKEDSRLYYAIARDGWRFADAVNGGRPIVAATLGDRLIRDPMILRDPDGKTFHLIATNGWKNRSLSLFDSPDLVHWENERLVQVAPERADMVWAPELLWDPGTRQFAAYWTSSTDGVWKTAAIWYATSPDLKTFSAPKVLMREQNGCLDADIMYAAGKWHMVYRYTGIWTRTAEHALGPYEDPVKILDLDVEGPSMFPVNGTTNQWGLIFDYFGGNQGRWGFATSGDLTHWTVATRKEWPYYTPDIFLPPGVRHGSVLPINAEEADTILRAFGSSRVGEKGPVPK